MTRINYEKIINEYSEQAFNDCVRQLFPLAHFCFLEEKDIRRCDLIEICYRFEKEYSNDDEINNTADNYGRQIQKLAKKEFNPDKSIEGYSDKASRLINKICNGSDNIHNLEDLAKIFICFMRCHWPTWNDSSAKNYFFVFDVEKRDSQMLQDMMNHNFVKDTTDSGILWNKKVEYTYYDKHFMKHLYFVTVVLYCRLMQFEGCYLDKGDEGNDRSNSTDNICK